jgi:hypothetical protein
MLKLLLKVTCLPLFGVLLGLWLVNSSNNKVNEMPLSINLLDYISEEKPVEDAEVNSLMPRGRSAKSEIAKMDTASDPYNFLGDFAEKVREAFQSPEDFERVFMKASKPIVTSTPKAQTRAAAVTSALAEAQGVPLETPNIQADVPEVPQAQFMPSTTPAPSMRTSSGGIMSMSTPAEDMGTDAADFMQTNTFTILKGVEGYKDKAYLGVINEKNRSGLTVGAGLDLGQHSKEGLLKMGVPASVVEKADKAGWIGLNAANVIDPETGKPAANRARAKQLLSAKVAEQKANGTFPEFTPEEVAAFTKPVYKNYEKAAKSQYEGTYGEGSWNKLNQNVRAVLSTEKYHRGGGYTLPDAMLKGARKNDAQLAASGIKDASRRRNMQYWLKEIGE